jgi:hypothetical protein
VGSTARPVAKWAGIERMAVPARPVPGNACLLGHDPPSDARTSPMTWKKRTIRAPSEPDKRYLAEVAGHGERSATLHLTLEQ